MGRTSEHVKEKIATLWRSGKGQTEIVKLLKAQGFRTTRQTVAFLTKRLKETGNMAYKLPTGKPSTLTDIHHEFIDANMKINDQLTAIGTYT